MRYLLEGLDCAHCAAKLEAELKKTPGLQNAVVNFTTRTLEAPDEHRATILEVLAKVEPDVVLVVPETKGYLQYELEGLHCAHCAAKLETALRKVAGLEDIAINAATRTVLLPKGYESDAQDVIKAIEPNVKLTLRAANTKQPEPSNVRDITRIAVAALLLVVGIIFNKQLKATPYQLGEYVVVLSSFMLVGWSVVYRAIKNILRGQIFDENFLMTIASIGAIAIGELPEAAAVMVFYAVGEFFQELQVNRSRRSISALLSIRPEYANLLTHHGVRQVAPESVKVGQQIVVKPGERIPLDGEVVEGESYLDTSALTGESVPRKVTIGQAVLAGVINTEGLLKVVVKKTYANSSVARILELVERASERKAPAERFITSFARVYTPVVVISAALLAVLPPLLLPGAMFSDWLYRALVLLVISCPCALVVSVPLSYFGGIGAASRHGVLFKGANYLDALTSLNTVVFDKTGTLTKGVFKVTKIVPAEGYTQSYLLSIAAAMESHSNHPVSKSICAAATVHETTLPINEVREIPGKGLTALVNGQTALIGNHRLLSENGVMPDAVDVLGTVVHVAIANVYIGHIVVSDEVREDAPSAVADLKTLGAQEIIMLTGDRQEAANKVAAAVGIDRFSHDLLPEQKVAELESIRQAMDSSQGKLVFVGDGINDAPVIARADIGVAMGGLGSDAAIEAADIVIMDDSPRKLVTATKIALHTKTIVKQNVALSLLVKAGFMALGVLGITSIWGAVFADVGVALLAVLNATRALRFSEHRSPSLGLSTPPVRVSGD